MNRILVTAIALCVTVFSTISAQTSVQTNFTELLPVENSLLGLGDDNWSYFVDQELRICYIDFEKISVNLNDIAIVDDYGEVIFKDKVWDLPVDTIYEIDLNNFPKGTYQLELRSFTNTFKQSLSIE